MPLCIFEGCRSGSRSKNYVKDNTVHLHKFPKDESLRAKWISQINKGSNVQNINCDTGIVEKIFKLAKIEHVFCLYYV